jgi:hypothetical protein
VPVAETAVGGTREGDTAGWPARLTSPLQAGAGPGPRSETDHPVNEHEIRHQSYEPAIGEQLDLRFSYVARRHVILLLLSNRDPYDERCDGSLIGPRSYMLHKSRFAAKVNALVKSKG